MTTVGIYVDGPNVEMGLYTAGDIAVLERVGSLLMEHAQGLGEVVEAKVFLDEATMWRRLKTREDYELNGFYFQESKSFKRVDSRTGAISFGKSLTDPSMHCFIVDRLHDPDCPEVMVLVTGDKDITVALEYIHDHEVRAEVVGEANSLSGFLVTKCESYGFGCHVIQLLARSSKLMQGHPAPRAEEEPERCTGLRVTDEAGKPMSTHKYMQYRNDRSNQKNPNNIAFWRSRGFRERPSDWEERLRKEGQKENRG
ncbi:MAG: NYN domain-containing protein [Methanomassiliicoccus sp.]|nr:NYN domain-containing protein [Methanomassiliicoccus sp.]